MARKLFVECDGRNSIHCEDPFLRDTDHNIFDNEDEVLPPCELNDDGSFGNVEESETNPAVTVSFIYQVETEASITPDSVENDALRSIEQSLTRVLSSQIFACSADGVRRIRRLQDGLVEGISGDPEDQLLRGTQAFSCESFVSSEAERCYLVGGQYTLYGPDADRMLLPALQATSAQLSNLERPPGVLHIQYIEGVSDPNDPRFKGSDTSIDRNGGTNGIQTQGASDDGIQAWPLILIGSACVVLIAGLFVRRRYKKQRSGDFASVTANFSGDSNVAARGNSPNPRTWHQVESAYMQDDYEYGIGKNILPLAPGLPPAPARSPFHSQDNELEDIFEDSDDSSIYRSDTEHDEKDQYYFA